MVAMSKSVSRDRAAVLLISADRATRPKLRNVIERSDSDKLVSLTDVRSDAVAPSSEDGQKLKCVSNKLISQVSYYA